LFYNDWLMYDLPTKDMWVNHYPYEDYNPTTYQDALVRQCRAIAENVKPAIFVSGGVDSHAAALGFKWADVDADFVHIKNSFNGHICEVEWEFTKAFAKRYDIDLKVIDMEYDKDSLRDFMIESEYFEDGKGSGSVFTAAGNLKYMEKYDGHPIGTDGHFRFENEGNIHRGIIKKPGMVLGAQNHIAAHTGYEYDNWGAPVILMPYYAPYLFQYFEMKHRTSPELRILNQMESKVLIYSELGLPLRPKLSNWEFLDLENDYHSLSTIDFADDHSKNARFERGPSVIVKALGFEGDEAKELIETKRKHQNTGQDKSRRFVIYEFEELSCGI